MRTHGLPLFCGVFVVALATAVGAASQPAGGPLLFRNVRVFDGVQVLPKASVLVTEGRIAAVGDEIEAPANATLVEGTGKTLLPGLIDSHTHTFSDEQLQQALVFGVTTELDMFTVPETARRWRAEQSAGEAVDRTDLFSAGVLATAPGGHGTEYGIEIPTLSQPNEAPAWVEARIAEGSDYIKLVYDDGSAYGLDFPTLSPETMRAVVAAAHERDRLALAHIGTANGAREAITAGVDGLVHLFADRPPDDDLARLAADHKIFVIPTLTVIESLAGNPGGEDLLADESVQPWLGPQEEGNLKRAFPFERQKNYAYRNAELAVAALRAAEVPLLAGTDAPNPGTTHGASMHRELELLVDAGLTPTEALVAATSAPALAFDLEDRGRIAPGRRADLVLVDGDPTRDIRATRAIVGVWKASIPVDRASYRERIERTRQAASAPAPVPPGSEAGLISDFDDGTPAARFGSAWQASTDEIAGGQSTVTFRIVDPGADGTPSALEMEGEVAPGLPYAWSGVLFHPGVQPFAPSDLSAHDGLRFFARGDGATYRIMLFTRSGGFMPISRTFVARPEWQPFEFPFSDFADTVSAEVTAVVIAAGPEPGPFRLRVDEISLVRSGGDIERVPEP